MAYKDHYMFCVKNELGDFIVLLTKIAKSSIGDVVWLGKWRKFNFRHA